jgi:hypothetical protein
MRFRRLGGLTIAASLASALAFADGDSQRTYQTTNMFVFGNPSAVVAGGATLFRSKQGVEMRVATSGLHMNSSYTVWWVVFNNPAACIGGCGLKDLSNPAARPSVLYAAGFVTGLGDSGNVTAHLDAGTPPNGVDVELGNGLERGNGLAADIHLVVRTHGVTTPGVVAHQIGSFNGGCSPSCSNVQAAMFPAVADRDEE